MSQDCGVRWRLSFISEREWDKCRENREKGGGLRNVLIRDTAATPYAMVCGLQEDGAFQMKLEDISVAKS